MNTIESTAKLEEILRNMLITQSELEPDRVLNSLSIHGEDLDKLFEEQIYVSLDRTDAVLFFELSSRQSMSNISNDDDDNIETYQAFSLKCIVYGNDSLDIATNVVSRLRMRPVIDELQAYAIYLEEVSEIDTINEYKNDTMWQRNDFSLDISCRFKIKKVLNDYSIANAKVEKIYQI